MKKTKANLYFDEHTRRELFYCSIFIWVTFILFLITRFVTVIVQHISVNMSQVSFETVMTVMETNPVAKYIFNLQGISYMIQFAVLPAAMMTLYYYFRRRVLKQKMSVEGLSLYVNFAFFICLVDFLNDLSVLLGLLLR
jgi:hypothetical protein